MSVYRVDISEISNRAIEVFNARGRIIEKIREEKERQENAIKKAAKTLTMNVLEIFQRSSECDDPSYWVRKVKLTEVEDGIGCAIAFTEDEPVFIGVADTAIKGPEYKKLRQLRAFNSVTQGDKSKLLNAVNTIICDAKISNMYSVEFDARNDLVITIIENNIW